MMNRRLLTILLAAQLGYAGRVGPFLTLPNEPTINAVKRDAAGNLYLAGSTPTTPGQSSPTDAFVAKLSSDGKVLFWTTFGGRGSEATTALALSSDGGVTAVGNTSSIDFPLTATAAQSLYPGTETGFFARLGAEGKVLYASFLNSNTSTPNGILPTDLAVDSTGASYITGSGPFAATPGALASANGGSFLLKLDAAGKLVFGTGFIGGGHIAVDSQGSIYLAGGASANYALPVAPGAYQSKVPFNVCGGGLQLSFPCTYQFIVKLDPAASKLIYATWISGSFGALPAAIAVDGAGNVIVTGTTQSNDYPVTAGAYQTSSYATNPISNPNISFPGPPLTGYVTKLNSSGSALIFSTYLGGSGTDAIRSMAVDAMGRIYLGGVSTSPDFPGLPPLPGACRPTYIYPSVFVTRLDADGSSLTSTQLAFGLLVNGPTLIAFDGQGNATA